jgi:hypothetical protein
MDILGLRVVCALGVLALWQIVARVRTFVRLQAKGVPVQAVVTSVKRESRLVTQTGSATTTRQIESYVDALYAIWKDPLTAHEYTSRIEIVGFHQFSVGESILLMINPENPNEYRLASSKRFRRG